MRPSYHPDWQRSRAPRADRPKGRGAIDTPEGRLTWNLRPWPWHPPGRQHLAHLNGHAISDDELRLRLLAEAIPLEDDDDAPLGA